jgi:hypothetical protein
VCFPVPEGRALGTAALVPARIQHRRLARTRSAPADLRVPKPVPPGKTRFAAGPRARRVPGRLWLGAGWDDRQFVGLKLIFLVFSRVVSMLGLSRRESWWKDAEILMLRHQLAVTERERPGARFRLTWPDRAWLALLAGTLPLDRLAAMRSIVTPGTILRWHQDIVRRRWDRWSRRGRSGRPATHRRVRSEVLRLARETSPGVTGGSTASWLGSVLPSPGRRSGRSSSAPGSTRRHGGTGRPGLSS